MSISHGELLETNYLIYGDNNRKYFFEFYNWDEVDDDIQYFTDSEGKGILGYVGVNGAIGFHMCKKSRVWEDIDGYIDTLQKEADLSDGKYIVCYYVCDDNLDLLQYVDYGITKEQIIDNVEAQKYMEGATYFLMESMREFIW